MAKSTSPDHNWFAVTDGGCKDGVATICGHVTNFATDERITFNRRVVGGNTNNFAELSAVAFALEMVSTPPSRTNILIMTDSQYAIEVLTLWHKANANKELVESIKRRMSEFHSVRMVLGREHSGNKANAIADKLATNARGED